MCSPFLRCLWVSQVEKLKAKFEVLSKGGVSKVSSNIKTNTIPGYLDCQGRQFALMVGRKRGLE
jgi:hypothetical protein